MNRSKLSVLSLSLATALLFSACGSDDDNKQVVTQDINNTVPTINVSSVGVKLPYTVLDADIIDGAKTDGSKMEVRNGGYGSASAKDPKAFNRFYALTDRGPNATYTGDDGKGKMFPAPDYTPRIGHFEVQEDGSVLQLSEILLKDTNGENISGLPNSSALGGTGETPYDKNGDTIKNSDGTIKTDDFGLDGEGLAVLSDGTFWVSDEYGPHMVHFDATGKEIGRINAFADDTRNTFTLPAEFQNRRANRGMEGLTITPDEKTLVGIMQSTMYNSSSAVKTLDITRIVTVNLETGAIAQYLYKQEKAANSNSEITALSNDTFLVIERDGTFAKDTADGQKHVYKITLSSGTNLEEVTLAQGMEQNATVGLTLDGMTLEEAVLDLEGSWDKLSANGIFPVTKSLVVDMIEENGYPHDKMEGLVVFDESTLGVLNDDDFATWSSGGVLEQKYLDAAKTEIDGNTLYVVKDLNLSTSAADEEAIKVASQTAHAVEKEAAIARMNAMNVQTLSEPLTVSFNSVAMIADVNSAAYADTMTVGSASKALTYTPLMATGYSDNSEIFGAVKNVNGELITFSDGSPYICNGTNDGVGSGLDFTSILHKDDKIFMVSQFECSIGAMYMAELEQSESGILTPKANTLRYIDQSSEFGGWTHCAGMTTPWQSHLGSEEYESNAKDIEAGSTDQYYSELQQYWGSEFDTITPYYYGWITETKIDAQQPVYTKHYSMGRFSHELAYIMPDEKTAYLSDDGTNVGFYMFVADSAQDLSSGTLYAAKFEQKELNRGGSFDLEWISLGHASDTEVRDMVASKPKFSDIFETANPVCAQQCPTGFTSINTTAGHECLKVKSGKELMASRLETRRYAAMLGATTEIRKEEGITYDPVHNRLYVAISEIARGMEDSESYDAGGNKDITLPLNYCGAVYALDLEKSDTLGSNYAAQNFYSIVFGEPTDYSGTEYEGNTCSIDGISNPDNVTYIPNSDVLLISEDTSNHKNNMVWAFNVVSGSLERVAIVPAGAEASGIFWYQNINNFSYLSLVTQHPSKAKESEVGLFSIESALTPTLILAEDQASCESNGNVWNTDLAQCFISAEKPDYSVAAANDVVTTSSSCYTTGEGVVFGSDFECGLTQPWKIYSTSSDIDWHVVNYGSYFMKITGYEADAPSDDWMISPKMTLTGDEILSFDYALNYSPSVGKVLVSADYDGTSNPADATWDELAVYTDSKGSWDFYGSGDISLAAYAGKEIYIAFHHTNEETGTSGTWEIDNVSVSGSGSVTVPFQGDFTVSKTAVLTTEYVEMQSSVSGGDAPYSYVWDLGNGVTSTQEKFCYRYENAGVFNVTVTVTDDDGLATTSEAKTITVNTPLDENIPENAADIRIATFNAYLNREKDGELYSDLVSGNDTQIKNVAHIIQLIKPDVVLINEFDYNGTENVDLLLEKYLKVAQGDDAAIDYPYSYVAPVNTGVQSGLDYNEDNVTDGNDAFGFGNFAGQYGMVIFSKYPIDTANVRTFQKFLWKDMPDFYEPMDGTEAYYTTEVMNQYRLSSKSHWDVPVTVAGKTIHILASHPTPPTFDDGDKDVDSAFIDWNGLRNHDEIRLWADYVAGENYIYDDANVAGGLVGDNRFVIMGDQNADPDEGDSYKNAIMQLLDNALINSSVIPTSLGATSEGANSREEDDTASWSMRADYVLPSTYGFEVDDCGVFWPQLSDVKHYLVEQTDGSENSSDHRLVWCDLNITDANSTQVSVAESNNTFSTDFESNSFGNWSTVNYASDDYNWEVVNYGSYMAKMTAYKDAVNTADDWLISPATVFEAGQLLDFDHVLNYDGSVCKVLISTDYDGQGNPVSATWTTLATYTDSMGSWDLRATDTINLSGYAGMNGYIAFQYTNTVAGTAGTWEIDNIALSK